MENKLKNIIANVFGIDIKNVNDLTSKDTIENWDSVNQLNLLLSLEESYNLSFTDEESIQLTNYKLVKSILQAKGISF